MAPFERGLWQTAGPNGDGAKVAIVYGDLATSRRGGASRRTFRRRLWHYVRRPGHTPPNVNNRTTARKRELHSTELAVAEYLPSDGAAGAAVSLLHRRPAGFQQSRQQLQSCRRHYREQPLRLPRAAEARYPAQLSPQPRLSVLPAMNKTLVDRVALPTCDDHWPGTFADGYHNGNVDLVNLQQAQVRTTSSPHFSGGGSSRAWAKWPTSNLAITCACATFR